MPQKTIYVSEADLPVFEQAQALAGGNLSSTIVRALRRYVEENLQEGKNMQNFEVKVGKVAFVLKRFNARLLARGFIANDENGAQPTIRYTAFETKRGKIALHTNIIPSLSQSILQRRGYSSGEGEYRFEIFDSIENLKPLIPSEFYDVVKANFEGVNFEELDI
jgi:EXLDI family protein